jgi:pimeloyl-ACP methyl ester carboxylesterase
MDRRMLEREGEGPDEPESVDLSAVRCPVLVTWGDRDHDDFKLIGERLAAELPDAHRAVIEGASHLPAMERPEATAALLREFLGA